MTFLARASRLMEAPLSVEELCNGSPTSLSPT